MGGLGVVFVIVMYLVFLVLAVLFGGGFELVLIMCLLSLVVLVFLSMSVICGYF